MVLFVLPTAINPEGIDRGFYGMVLAAVVGLVLGFILMMFSKLPKEDMENEESIESKEILVNKEILVSPLKGNIMALSDVEDAAFASGALGKGVAITPVEGKVFAPADGTLTTLFPTSHALGITTDNGAEILIHVGMDTVQLEGKYFNAKVKQGEKVKKGQLLLEFDINEINKAGFSTVTPVIVTNFDSYLDVVETDKKKVDYKEELLTVVV